MPTNLSLFFQPNGDASVRPAPLPLAAALTGAVAAGDWLLRGDPGLSFALFLWSLGLLAVLRNWGRLDPRSFGLAAAVLVLALLPWIEEPGILPFLFAVSGTMASCLILGGRLGVKDGLGWAERLDLLVSAHVSMPMRLPIVLLSSMRQVDGRPARTIIGAWLVPVFLACIFLLLFALANPVLERWFESLDLLELLEFLFSARTAFWLLLAWCAAPFIEAASARLRLFALGSMTAQLGGFSPRAAGVGETLLWERTLTLCNFVFGIQSSMDAVYLWSGVGLPEGMSYGEYAHRGAYPLVATALLAALFVLIVTRRGGPGERSAHLRQLLYLWVGQNVLLVASSALRNARYVEVYGLTEWRIAAFIWMALVAAGLTFIIVRFVQGRTLGWLVTANAALLAGVLYACCFVNFPHLIASHNLANWQGVKDGGSILDLNHLRRLGPRALPAILAFRAKHPKTTPFHDRKLAQVSFLLKPSAKSRLRSDWRSWGFAMQRLNWQIDRLHADCCPRISRRHPARRAP